jgi:hypothetical protein
MDGSNHTCPTTGEYRCWCHAPHSAFLRNLPLWNALIDGDVQPKLRSLGRRVRAAMTLEERERWASEITLAERESITVALRHRLAEFRAAELRTASTRTTRYRNAQLKANVWARRNGASRGAYFDGHGTWTKWCRRCGHSFETRRRHTRFCPEPVCVNARRKARRHRNRAAS